MSKVELKAEDLEPCPFCGSSSVFPNGVEPAVFVECDGCGASSGTCHGDTEAEAISAWNRRPALSDHRPPVEGADELADFIRDQVCCPRPQGCELNGADECPAERVRASIAAPPSPPVEALGVREAVERLTERAAWIESWLPSKHGTDSGAKQHAADLRLILSALSTAPLSLGGGKP